MKILLRAWTLTLDFAMLVLLFAAPGRKAPDTSAASRRPELPAFAPDETEFLTPSPVYVRVEQSRPRR